MIDLPTEANPVVVIEGDCLTVLRQMGGFDAVVTDPPYGIELGATSDKRAGKHGSGKPGYLSFTDTYEAFVSEIVPRLNLALSLANRGAVFSGPHIHEQRKPDAIGGVYTPACNGRHCWGFKNFHPVLLYGKAPDLNKGAKEPTVFRSNSTDEKNGHPCPKPVEWMRWLIRLSTRPGELIVDPFAGSGTTGVAAALEGRRCILIEKEPAYAAICRARIAKVLDDGLFAGVASEQPDLFADAKE